MTASLSDSEPQTTGISRLGRYVVTGTLGQGAMGTVYRAEDPLIERKVALKVLSLDLPEHEREQFREHFFREGKSAGRLNHPNVVTVYDIGESEGVPYIAMEFLQGLTLRETLDMGTVMPVRRVVDIGLAVCRGLDFAHGQGVIHRDVKPANIMLTRSGMVKIMDFGIAQSHFRVDPGTELPPGQVLGSPKYMAPEQVQGLDADERADLFSLGVTLYELLVGRNPFEADSVNEVIEKVLHLEPPTARSQNPDVPEALDDLVFRAMRKDPDERYASARDMGKMLRSLRRELRAAQARGRTLQAQSTPPGDNSAATVVMAPTAQRPQSPKPTANAPRRSRRAMRVGLAALAVLGIVGLGIGYFAEDPPPAKIAAAPPVPAPAPVEVDIFAPPILPLPPVDEAPPAFFEKVEPPPARVVRSRRPARKPPPAPVGHATLSFSVLPWGQVFVDGKLAGVSPPLRSLRLAPGEYRIEIRNLDFPPFVTRLTLESKANQRIRHRFGK